jgi:hypothetical protein
VESPIVSNTVCAGVYRAVLKSKCHSAVLPPLNRSKVVDAIGVITFSNVGSSLLAIASTAAARTRHFFSEHGLAKAASIFGSRSVASSCPAAARTAVLSSLTDSLEHLVPGPAERHEPNAGLELNPRQNL